MTTGISSKGTSVLGKAVTEEFKKFLDEERKALHVEKLLLAVDNKTSDGTTSYKLGFGKGKPTQIVQVLSEGEQRTLAIAAFFAELKTIPLVSGLIFDDPVSSLDHMKREFVANRLVKEAEGRQVIVFTHDLTFLMYLASAAERACVLTDLWTVSTTALGAGKTEKGVPYHGASIKERIGMLKAKLQTAAATQARGDESTYKMMIKDGYTHLRDGWERAVEEMLFAKTVLRFQKGVSTNLLRYVMVEDTDWDEVEPAMTHCSKYAHDAAAEMNPPTPTPEDFGKDIEALDAFRKRVDERNKSTEKRRKAPVSLAKAGA